MGSYVGVVKGAALAISVITKGVNCCFAAKRVYDLASKDRDLTTSEKIDLAANLIFISFQALEAGVQVHDHVQKNGNKNGKYRFAASVATGTADVTRTVTTKIATNKHGWSFSDTFDVIAVVSFRASDCARQGVEGMPNLCGEKVESGGYVCEAVSTVLYSREELILASKKILGIENEFVMMGGAPSTEAPQQVPQEYAHYKVQANKQFNDWVASQNQYKYLICPFSGRFIHNPIRCKQNPQLVIEKTVIREAQEETRTFLTIAGQNYPFDQFEKDVDQQLREHYLYQFNALQAPFVKAHETQVNDDLEMMRNFEKYDVIPALAKDDPRLVIRCAITREEVRRVIVPCAKVTNVHYENAALQKWLAEKPNVPPPMWPQELPFESKNIKPSKRLQASIDEILLSIAQELNLR